MQAKMIHEYIATRIESIWQARFDMHDVVLGRHGIDHVPVSINDMRTEYFVNVSVGSPRQTFTVLVDTGSSTLAIFSKLAPTHGRPHSPPVGGRWPPYER